MAMESSKGPSNFRNLNYAGKHSLLPPKSPFPCISPAYADYGLIPAIAPRAVQKPKEGNFYHQRTSSESLLVDEQPSWLEDLLNEPETPVKRVGHRRSSSDSSFAYLDIANSSNMDYVAQDEYKFKNLVPVPSWAAQESDNYKDMRHASSLAELNSIRRQKNRPWGPSPNFVAYPSTIPSAKDNIVLQNLGKPNPQDAAAAASTTNEKQETGEAGSNDMAASEKGDGSSAKQSATDTDTKRAKQQFAQRSRVRKLQYIAELERNVQALQAEGSEVTAELEFINQQNLILSLENKALKQRLDSLAQEQLIKYLEQEVLEREIGRLRTMFQQQQHQQLQPHPHQQPPSSSHRRTKSRELDSQFASLSLKHKDTSSGKVVL